MKPRLYFSALLLLATFPSVALATDCSQYNTGIFRGAYPNTPGDQPCAIDSIGQAFIIGANIISLLLVLTGGLFILFMVLAGIKYITSAGSSDQIQEAKNTFTNAIIGLIIVMLVYVIIRFVVTTIGGSIV